MIKGPARKRKLEESVDILKQLGFGPRQSNSTAAYALLACLDLQPEKSWHDSSDPLMGITPIIEFVGRHYGMRYAPNTRETIRDEAVKHFVVIHDSGRNWLLLIEAVTSAGPVDAKRRKELKDLFHGCTAGLVFVTAFATRVDMRSFLTQISWESEVWVAEDPNHMIHFNGEKFLGPYPDTMP